MSGTLVINSRDAWMPASWVFNHVLELVVAEIRNSGRLDLADAIVKVLRPNLEYLDLSVWPAEDIRLLRASLEGTHRVSQAAGGAGFQSKEFYEGYLARVADLKALLDLDPRLSRESPI